MIGVGYHELESWAVMRRRIIRETEVFLEDALRHPQRQVVIPAKPVGTGGFRREFAELFWAQVLTSS